MATDPLIEVERTHRLGLWAQLLSEGGPERVAPGTLRAVGIYGGAQGVWVDKTRTSLITPTGITVGILHTGSSYADDLSDVALVYHYPSTDRGPGRDASEVAATKAAGELGMPIFVITYPTPGSTVRDVRLGWVQAWDDAARTFLVRFGETQPPVEAPSDIQDETPFSLEGSGRPQREAKSKVRPGQPVFKFKCLRRYGGQCAVCGVAIASVLDAAHIRGIGDGGSDDPRNGLILCATHHRAFDAHLFTIDPDDLSLILRPGLDSDGLRLTQTSLAHLLRTPHKDALSWRLSRFKKRLGDTGA